MQKSLLKNCNVRKYLGDSGQSSALLVGTYLQINRRGKLVVQIFPLSPAKSVHDISVVLLFYVVLRINSCKLLYTNLKNNQRHAATTWTTSTNYLSNILTDWSSPISYHDGVARIPDKEKILSKYSTFDPKLLDTRNKCFEAELVQVYAQPGKSKLGGRAKRLLQEDVQGVSQLLKQSDSF